MDLFPGSQCLPNAVARISPFNFADADTVFEAVQHVYHENKHLLKALIGILCVVGAIIVALCILAGCDRYSSPSRDSHEEEERLSVRSVESNTGRSIEPNTGIH